MILDKEIPTMCCLTGKLYLWLNHERYTKKFQMMATVAPTVASRNPKRDLEMISMCYHSYFIHV